MPEEKYKSLKPRDFANLGFKADGTPRKPGPWCGAAGPGKPGRGRGNQNLRTKEVRDAARAIVDDPEYRHILRLRLLAGEASHMEVLLWHYAYGKPKDVIEVNTTTNDFEGVTAEQLRERARLIALRITDPDLNVVDSDPDPPAPNDDGSVH